MTSISDEEHSNMDKKIVQNLRYFEHISGITPKPLYILHLIVMGCPSLNQAYTDLQMGEDLLKGNPGLESLLQECLDMKKFKRIREHGEYDPCI
jgi:hypothetical protein